MRSLGVLSQGRDHLEERRLLRVVLVKQQAVHMIGLVLFGDALELEGGAVVRIEADLKQLRVDMGLLLLVGHIPARARVFSLRIIDATHLDVSHMHEQLLREVALDVRLNAVDHGGVVVQVDLDLHGDAADRAASGHQVLDDIEHAIRLILLPAGHALETVVTQQKQSIRVLLPGGLERLADVILDGIEHAILANHVFVVIRVNHVDDGLIDNVPSVDLALVVGNSRLDVVGDEVTEHIGVRNVVEEGRWRGFRVLVVAGDEAGATREHAILLREDSHVIAVSVVEGVEILRDVVSSAVLLGRGGRELLASQSSVILVLEKSVRLSLEKR